MAKKKTSNGLRIIHKHVLSAEEIKMELEKRNQQPNQQRLIVLRTDEKNETGLTTFLDEILK